MIADSEVNGAGPENGNLILIAEDSPTQAILLERTLVKNGFRVLTAQNGREAFDLALRHRPSLVISDIMMPVMDGFELCSSIKQHEELHPTTVILLTALSDPEDIIRALRANADCFLTKPFQEDQLLAQVRQALQNCPSGMNGEEQRHHVEVVFGGQVHVITTQRQQILSLLLSTYESAMQKNTELLQAKYDLQRLNSELLWSNQELSEAYETTLLGWSKALDLRDKETEGHTQRVTELTVQLARLMGFDEDAIVHLRRGALLHDIGKMGVPDSILLKPGPLTDEEWAIMKKHPVYAYELLSPIYYLQPALDIPYCHHEKWDGTGYPQGLKGEDIPLAARVFAIIDIWDALRSDRPYRPAWPVDRVVSHIRSLSGTHLDPAVVEAFLQLDVVTSPQKETTGYAAGSEVSL